MAKYARKSNGVSFQPLEARVAPMVIKLAESLERTIGGSGGSDDKGQAMFKIAKQIKKSTEAASDKRSR
jgi:hypothetical protein